jgi:hypothetical protein
VYFIPEDNALSNRPKRSVPDRPYLTAQLLVRGYGLRKISLNR